MLRNDFYTVENLGPYEFYSLGDYILEDGGIIPKCELAYRTFGTLNEEKNNLIVIPT